VGASPLAFRPRLTGPPPLSGDEATLRAISALRGRDPDQVAWVLRRYQPLPPQWAGFVVELLEDPGCRPFAEEALRRVAPVHLGLLADVVLNHRASIEMRRRVPALLGAVPTRRSALILKIAIDANVLEIRYRSALALHRIVRRNPELRPFDAEMFDAAGRELDRCRLVWTPSASSPSNGGDDPSTVRHEAGFALAYCVELLGTVLLEEPFLSAVDAMGSTDPSRRGTGIEYLENVLPASLFRPLRPLLERRSVVRFARRPRTALLEDLMDGTGSVRTLEQVRDRVKRWYG